MTRNAQDVGGERRAPPWDQGEHEEERRRQDEDRAADDERRQVLAARHHLAPHRGEEVVVEAALEDLRAVEVDEQEEGAEEDRDAQIGLEHHREQGRRLVHPVELAQREGAEGPQRDQRHGREGEEVHGEAAAR
jgi:hypothetical protein